MFSKRRPRAHIRIACGTQRGGANSDALAKFQFRDVGLLVILNWKCASLSIFSCCSQCKLHKSVPLPQSQVSKTGILWARFMPYLDTQELKNESLASGCLILGGWTLVMPGNETCPLLAYVRELALVGSFQP